MREVYGRLLGWSETGSEGTWWSLDDDLKLGYSALVVLQNGDVLTIFNSDGTILLHTVIQEDAKIGWKPSPRNPKVGQPVARGLWIHWTQKGWEPDAWADLFLQHPPRWAHLRRAGENPEPPATLPDDLSLVETRDLYRGTTVGIGAAARNSESLLPEARALRVGWTVDGAAVRLAAEQLPTSWKGVAKADDPIAFRLVSKLSGKTLMVGRTLPEVVRLFRKRAKSNGLVDGPAYLRVEAWHPNGTAKTLPVTAYACPLTPSREEARTALRAWEGEVKKLADVSPELAHRLFLEGVSPDAPEEAQLDAYIAHVQAGHQVWQDEGCLIATSESIQRGEFG